MSILFPVVLAILVFVMGGLIADIVLEYLFRVIHHAVSLVRSHKWPTVTASVLSADCPRAGYGCTVANVYYEYTVEGKKYADTFGKPFYLHASGQDYAGTFAKGAVLSVRVKPDYPAASVALWNGLQPEASTEEQASQSSR